MNSQRASGILLHPTSFPGRFGIGDLGDEAYKFIDFLQASGQRLWQILPLGPTGYGDSPYQSFSAFAGNTLLISPQRLIRDGLLSAEDLTPTPRFPAERVDFGAVMIFKNKLLARAFEKYSQTPAAHVRAELEEFCYLNSWWLDDYALFRALKDKHRGAVWNKWEPQLARRDEAALKSARTTLHDEVEQQKFYQYLFFKQWWVLKAHCRELGLRIIGDTPIFVAYDSADVWTNPHLFKLDEAGNPLVVAGVPPDYFSRTGQLWGNPIYNWERMRAESFEWWTRRMHFTLQTVDIVRLDHFRGFAACWEVPGRDKTAEHGQWVNVPGGELFEALRQKLGELPVIAEDLGFITQDVIALRDRFGFPGMRILQYGFGGDAHSRDLPHNYTRNAAAYTGTHDNDTIVGWFGSGGEGSTRSVAQVRREQEFALQYLDVRNEGEIHWAFIRAVLSSVADTAVVPLQDVLGLGTEARMNLPGSATGNWSWRYHEEALTEEISQRLRKMVDLYGRA